MPEDPIDTEELLYPERLKDSRVERKRLARTDRSKFKKTDWDKREKAPLPEGLERGRVLSIMGLETEVDLAGETLRCTLRGALKKEQKRLKNLVAVGDFVFVERIEKKAGAIVAVDERRTVLSRAEGLDRQRQHILAANIDQVLITVSVVQPVLRPSLIDRYIIATHKGGMEPIILLNKVDLLDNDPEQKALADEITTLYSSIGFTIIPLSVLTGEGVDQLRATMAEKTSVFSGQSGVGKSSLINVTCGLDLPVREVVATTRKGAHTTTRAHLVRLRQGGFCVDTPGIKSFGVWQLDPQEIESHFHEIQEIGQACKYPNCTHTHEPDCAVKPAVEENRINPLRYASYSALLEEAAQEHLRR